MEIIQNLAEALPQINSTKVLGEMADYQSNEKLFTKPFVWKAATETAPTSWWNGICRSTELSKIAGRILSLPPTSAAVERSFSRHSFIHSSKRNRLSTERAAKIVFIAHNIKYSEEDEPSAVGRTGRAYSASGTLRTARTTVIDAELSETESD